MIPSISALSQYLLEDLHEHQLCLRSFGPGKANELPLNHHGVRPERPESTDESRCGPVDGKTVDYPVRTPVGDGGLRGSLSGDPELGSMCLGVLPIQERSSDIGTSHPVVESFSSGTISRDGGDAWYPGAHPATVACRSLLKSITKKYRDLTHKGADEVAFRKFMTSNELCRNWMLNPQSVKDEELFGCLQKEVDDFLHPSGSELLVPSIDAIFDRGRVGPGASLGANGVDFYTKLFSSRLTATSFEVYYQYAERCTKYPTWGKAEFNRLIACGLPDIVRESKVTFVPKDLTQTRSICTEPSLNMFFQLGLGQILTERLKSHFGVDLRYQPRRNVRLARLGSIDGSVATIDLESASDSLSLGLCEAVFPRWFLDLLYEYRTPFTKVRGQQVELSMVSTMGNGFTFPLQTMLFSCVVRAVASWRSTFLGRASRRGARWGVFGDDIICPIDLAGDVVHLLRLIGFRVNSEKSYTERYGRFRESCGGDFYMGHNVRGVYIKSLRTPQSRYVAINLLNEWSAKWRIPLPRVVGYLQDSVRHLAVPPFAPIDSGIRIPLDLTLNRYGLWRNIDNGTFVYRCYEPYVPSIKVLMDRLTLPRGVYQLRSRIYNPDGLMFAFVGGYIRSSKIPIALKQGERPRYRMKTRRAPFWGPSVEQQHSHAAGFWGWWNTIVPFNLRLTES